MLIETISAQAVAKELGRRISPDHGINLLYFLPLTAEDRAQLAQGPVLNDHVLADRLPDHVVARLPDRLRYEASLELWTARCGNWNSHAPTSLDDQLDHLEHEAALHVAGDEDGAWLLGVPILERAFHSIGCGIRTTAPEYPAWALHAVELKRQVLVDEVARLRGEDLAGRRQHQAPEGNIVVDEKLLEGRAKPEGLANDPAPEEAADPPVPTAPKPATADAGTARAASTTEDAPLPVPAVAAQQGPARPQAQLWPLRRVQEAEDFATIAEIVLEELKKKNVAAGYWNKIKNAYRLFLDIMGNMPLSEITTSVAKEFRNRLRDLPSNHGKSIYQGINKLEAVERLRDVRAAIEAGVPAEDIPLQYGVISNGDEDTFCGTLAAKTVNAHLSCLRRIFKAYPDDERFQRALQAFTGIDYPPHMIKAEEKTRTPWAKPNIATLGAWIVSEERLSGSGLMSQAIGAWGPFLGVTMKMRLEEICQLRPEDVVTRQGIPCIYIRAGSGQRLKTPAAERIIPIPSYILECGFLEFAQEKAESGSEWLFPECVPAGPGNARGFTFSKRFAAQRRQLGLIDPTKDFHAFRMTLNTELASHGVRGLERDILLGHSSVPLADGKRYLHRESIPLARLLAALEKSTLVEALPDPREVRRLFPSSAG